MSRRRRGARKRKGLASPEARQCLPADEQELRVILACETLLDRARDIAHRIDDKMRQLLGPNRPNGPGPGLPERVQPDRAEDP